MVPEGLSEVEGFVLRGPKPSSLNPKTDTGLKYEQLCELQGQAPTLPRHVPLELKDLELWRLRFLSGAQKLVSATLSQADAEIQRDVESLLSFCLSDMRFVSAACISHYSEGSTRYRLRLKY